MSVTDFCTFRAAAGFDAFLGAMLRVLPAALNGQTVLPAGGDLVC